MTDPDDIELLNRVAAQPEVLAQVAPGYLSLDLTAFFDNPANIMLGDERGIVLFVALGNGVYGMHYLLTRSLRGPAALRAIKSAISDVFTYHGAHAITGATPRENRAARAVNRALGGHPIGVSEDSLGRPCINYMLERATWVRLSGA
jgi:hypothetical protein